MLGDDGSPLHLRRKGRLETGAEARRGRGRRSLAFIQTIALTASDKPGLQGSFIVRRSGDLDAILCALGREDDRVRPLLFAHETQCLSHILCQVSLDSHARDAPLVLPSAGRIPHEASVK